MNRVSVGFYSDAQPKPWEALVWLFFFASPWIWSSHALLISEIAILG
ncbi:MAG: hypothetical protein RLY60_453, partial [Pseudomonadota bacterium]